MESKAVAQNTQQDGLAGWPECGPMHIYCGNRRIVVEPSRHSDGFSVREYRNGDGVPDSCYRPSTPAAAWGLIRCLAEGIEPPKFYDVLFSSDEPGTE